MSGNTPYIAPDGKSLLQEQKINELLNKANTIENGLKDKVDATKYAGKIALLEANDTRHNADIAWLEEHKLDKTIFETKLNQLQAKDNIHDLRLATLDALKASKVESTDYSYKIGLLDAKDLDHDTRLNALQAQHDDLFNDVDELINTTLGDYVQKATLQQWENTFNGVDNALLNDINSKASLVIAQQIQAGLTAVNADMVTKVDFEADKDALEDKNVTWEKRLNAIDQYIRAMIETYEIKKPGDTAAYEYTAAFQKEWEMKEDHFTIVGRNPGGQIMVELPEFSYNTFYGSIKMFLNSNTDMLVPESTKVKNDVTASVPHRVALSYNINGMFEERHFPISIRMDNSAGEEIKIKTLTENDYKNLPIITGAAFTYPRTKFYLVKGFNGTDNNLNEMPSAILDSNLAGATWTMTGMPANGGISIDANGKITGFPSADFPLYPNLAPLEVTVKSVVQGNNENKLTLSFVVVAPHTISYAPATEYARNNDMPNLVPTVTNAVTPNDKLVFSVTNPDSDLAAGDEAAGMFTQGVYITKVTDSINNRVAGTIWGNPKNVINKSYNVKAVGLNGYEATFTLTLKVIDTPPSFDYKHFLPTGTTEWTNYTYTARVNDVVSFLPNVAESSGEIDGALYPGEVKPNYAIEPAFPAGSNLSFDAETGKIYSPVVAPVAGVAQPQGILTNFESQTYTITAYGPGGSSTATFKLRCLGPVPTFSYNPISMQFVKGVIDTTGYAPLNPVGVAATGGYALYMPDGVTHGTLPAGLNFNPNTGVISAPTAPAPTAAELNNTFGFSVIATGPNGSSIPKAFYVTVKDAVPAFSYASGVKTFVRGIDAGLNAFGPTGATGSGVINFYALFDNSDNPTVLPAGLYFNNDNGQVTGIPLFSNHGVAVTYKVKAYGPGGESAFQSFQLQINEPAPVIDYSEKYDGTAASVQHFTEGVEIDPISPSLKVNNIRSWTISGQPAGITIGATTGIISGTPTARGAEADVTVRATGDGGYDEVVFKMKVDYKTPKFAYPAGAQLVYAGENVAIAIAGVTEGLSAGTITWVSTPALPAGLSIGDSGTITGITTVLGGPVTYSIKATNADGKFASANVVINVDTQVAGATNLTVLVGDADYDVKYFQSTTSNSDKVFVKKVSAGDLADASLVYVNESGIMVEIAQANLVSSDFVAFALDRATQTANTDQKLYVIPNFVAGTSVEADAVAKIQYDVPALWVNPVPVLASISNVTVEKGAVFPDTTASVTNGVAVTWSLSGQPANMIIDSASGAISGTVTGNAGTYTVEVVATPAVGSPVSTTFVVTVTDPTPVLATISDATVEKGAFFGPIQATVTNSIEVNWNILGALTGLSIDSVTGVISGTVTANAGTYTVEVVATPKSGSEASFTTFILTVTEPAAPSLPKLTVSGTRSALTLSFTPNITGSGFYTTTGNGVNWGVSGTSFDVTAGVPIILERNYSWSTLDPLYITIRSPFGEQLTTIELVPV